MTSANLAKYPEIYMPCPFAGEADQGGTSGTNRSKPFSDVTSAANVNMRTGFPTVFSQALSANGKYLARPDMNQLGYLATVGQYRKQNGCLNEYNEAFVKTIGGYAKGAVLDLAIKENGIIVEVWKIVSLTENNQTKPEAPTASSTGNIIVFNVGNVPASAKWMRVSPDKAYVEGVREDCKLFTTNQVNAEASARTNADNQRILTSLAAKRFASGKGVVSSDGCIDGTATDIDGNAVEMNVAVSDGGKDGYAWCDALQRDVKIARKGHIHTNMYTKAEIDKLIKATENFAAGTTSTTGAKDGTYKVDPSGSVYGHKHDECSKSYQKFDITSGKQVFYPNDGTAHDSSGNITNTLDKVATGHVHTNYATTEYVERKSITSVDYANKKILFAETSTVGQTFVRSATIDNLSVILLKVFVGTKDSTSNAQITWNIKFNGVEVTNGWFDTYGSTTVPLSQHVTFPNVASGTKVELELIGAASGSYGFECMAFNY